MIILCLFNFNLFYKIAYMYAYITEAMLVPLVYILWSGTEQVLKKFKATWLVLKKSKWPLFSVVLPKRKQEFYLSSLKKEKLSFSLCKAVIEHTFFLLSSKRKLFGVKVESLEEWWWIKLLHSTNYLSDCNKLSLFGGSYGQCWL